MGRAVPVSGSWSKATRRVDPPSVTPEARKPAARAASVAADLRGVGEHLHDLDEGDNVTRGVFFVVLVELDRVDAHVAPMSYKVR